MATATTTREATMIGVLVSLLAIVAGCVRNKLCCLCGLFILFIIHLQGAAGNMVGWWQREAEQSACSIS